jgi:hypothetical protein
MNDLQAKIPEDVDIHFKVDGGLEEARCLIERAVDGVSCMFDSAEPGLIEVDRYLLSFDAGPLAVLNDLHPALWPIPPETYVAEIDDWGFNALIGTARETRSVDDLDAMTILAKAIGTLAPCILLVDANDSPRYDSRS